MGASVQHHNGAPPPAAKRTNQHLPVLTFAVQLVMMSSWQRKHNS